MQGPRSSCIHALHRLAGGQHTCACFAWGSRHEEHTCSCGQPLPVATSSALPCSFSSPANYCTRYVFVVPINKATPINKLLTTIAFSYLKGNEHRALVSWKQLLAHACTDRREHSVSMPPFRAPRCTRPERKAIVPCFRRAGMSPPQLRAARPIGRRVVLLPT